MAVLTQRNNHEALVTDIFSVLAYERVTINMWKPCTNTKLKVKKLYKAYRFTSIY